MSNYPDVITPEVLAKCVNISNQEIRQDIAETEQEIKAEQKKAEGYRLVVEGSTNLNDRKMAYFRQVAAEQSVRERQAFVAFLNKLLQARQEQQA